MSISQLDLLAAATVRVVGTPDAPAGTGFFVAPGFALTTANLVGCIQRSAGAAALVPGEGPIELIWQGSRYTARCATFLPEADLALLAVDLPAHPCVLIQEDYQQAQRLHCFGYPLGADAGQVCFPTIADWLDQDGRPTLTLTAPDSIDLVALSGAALLNEQTGGVCAMVTGARAVDREWLHIRSALHSDLLTYFSLNELRTLCFELGFALDDLPRTEQGREHRAVEVIRWMDQRGRINELIATLVRQRPRSPLRSAGHAAQPDDGRFPSSHDLIVGAYADRLARGLTMASVLGLIDLVPRQRAAHAADTRWIDTLSEAQMLGAGRCFPEDVAPPPCPYPGLKPFTSPEHFHGRTKDVAELITWVASPALRLLIVTGASGCGKSSLVQAGLLPQLRAIRGLHIITDDVMRLNDQPLSRLIDALECDDQQQARNDPGAAARALLTRCAKARLVLLIDQFEDVLTPAAGQGPTVQEVEQQRQGALDLVQRLWRETDLPLVLLLVVRPEALAQLAQAGFETLPELTKKLEPLSGDDLRAAIERPAAAAGVHIEPDLVGQLVTEASTTTNPLPLLQVTLASLWNSPSMRRRRLTLAAYQREIKTLTNAIQRDATLKLTRLSPAQQLLARNMVLRLVELHELRDTRRPQPWEQLVTVGEPLTAQATLSTLVDMGLLVTDRYQGTVWVELCHDALIANWSTLRDEWLGRGEPAAGQHSLRRCETQRRVWEQWVTVWEQSVGTQLLTSPPLIAEAARWDTACGQHLGPIPKLDALITTSRRAQRNARALALIFIYVTVCMFVISICFIVYYFSPLIP